MRTDGRIKLSPGTLYGAIRRLLEDGLILEVHPDPNKALCDGKQSITPEQLRSVVHETRLMNHVLMGHAFLANEPSTLQKVV